MEPCERSAREIRELCLRLLSGRDHSKKELLQKLTVKGYERDTVLAVIDELAEKGWQDDLRYAESYARSRILKGYGPVRIAYELRQNGVDISLDNCCRAHCSDRDVFDLEEIVHVAAGGWLDLMEKVYRKKYGCEKVLDGSEWAKRSRFLLQRGFTAAMISELFEHLTIKLIYQR
ncbi:MAG: regulatory protein RecX [Gammaproteobacteria bacterium]